MGDSAPWLHNCWYQAGWVDELPAGVLLARSLLDQPLVFFRDSLGSPAALLDRCPHRFAPLSSGKLDRGTVTCGYHGLVFDGTGACSRNPHGPITSAMRARAYQVVERHHALWVWMGEPDSADLSMIPQLPFIDETPENSRIKGYMPTAANYQLLTDNILDLSHADYLHPTTLGGGGMMTRAKASTRDQGEAVVAEWLAEQCDPPPAFHRIVPPPAKADIWLEVTWTAPAVMVQRVAATVAGVPRQADDITTTLHNMTPETNTTAHYFYCFTRRFRTDDVAFSERSRANLNQAFTCEDKPILELQQARMGTHDLWSLNPILLRIDAAAVRARKRLEKLISDEADAISSDEIAHYSTGKGI